MRSRIVATFAAVVALALSMACESENGGSLGAGNGTGGNGTGGTGGGASELEVTSCKSSCDKLKFFDCNDSFDQAACYANCDAASPSQIDLFNGCVSTDTCDPTCSTTIEPKAAEPSGGTGGDAGSGGGSVTGGEPEPKDPVEACHAACDHLKFFGCLSADDQAACRDLCPSAKDADRDTFTACAASGCDAACYKSLDPSFVPKASEFDQKRCDNACDGYKFFDCISAAEHSVCVDLCKTAPADKVDAFSGCAKSGGDCDTVDCLDAFAQD
jgi:hypothetical protein